MKRRDYQNENKLGILISNPEKNSQTIYKLNLLDIVDENIKIPPAEFETELSLPSGDFQKIIRDMINIGENIEIKSIGSQLLLNCVGDLASQETILGETNNGLKFNQISAKSIIIRNESTEHVPRASESNRKSLQRDPRGIFRPVLTRC